MPFNYEKQIFYKVNFDEVGESILNEWGNVFESKIIFEQYINEWMNLLKEKEIFCTKRLKKLSKLERAVALSKEGQMFQTSYLIGKTTIYLHFRISKLLSQLRLEKLYGEDIETSIFNKADSVINWDKDIDISEYSSCSKEPILIIPMPGSNTQYDLIDGNHRVKKYLLTNKRTIKGYVLNEKTIFDGNYIGGSMEKLFYLFLMEYDNFGYASKKKKISIQEMRDLSYLYTNKYMF